MLVRLIAIAISIAAFKAQSERAPYPLGSNSTQPAACHELFSNCALCDPQLTTCLQCNSGYFQLYRKFELTPAKP